MKYPKTVSANIIFLPTKTIFLFAKSIFFPETILLFAKTIVFAKTIFLFA